jgi:predicted patatin/cPLA2 family phospholipase
MSDKLRIEELRKIIEAKEREIYTLCTKVNDERTANDELIESISKLRKENKQQEIELRKNAELMAQGAGEMERLRARALDIAKEFHESYERGIADGENAIMAIEEMLNKLKGDDDDNDFLHDAQMKQALFDEGDEE